MLGEFDDCGADVGAAALVWAAGAVAEARTVSRRDLVCSACLVVVVGELVVWTGNAVIVGCCDGAAVAAAPSTIDPPPSMGSVVVVAAAEAAESSVGVRVLKTARPEKVCGRVLITTETTGLLLLTPRPLLISLPRLSSPFWIVSPRSNPSGNCG
jgi:hypothetical protein